MMHIELRVKFHGANVSQNVIASLIFINRTNMCLNSCFDIYTMHWSYVRLFNCLFNIVQVFSLLYITCFVYMQSELHGLAALQWSICQDSLRRFVLDFICCIAFSSHLCGFDHLVTYFGS